MPGQNNQLPIKERSTEKLSNAIFLLTFSERHWAKGNVDVIPKMEEINPKSIHLKQKH